MDQARDMLAIRHMVVTKIPKIVGPTTSINGVFLGPFWYYFNLPAFLLGQGNPATLVYWNIFCYQVTGLLIWLYFYKKDKILAVTTSTLFLIAPTGFDVTRYVWNANPMPMFTALFLLLVFDIVHNSSKFKQILLGVISGLFLQIESAFAIIFIPFTFFIFFSQLKNIKKSIKYFLSGFLPTLIPQIIFELRHNFVISKTFLDEFMGRSVMLGERLNFFEIINDRFMNFQNQLLGTLYLQKSLIFLLFITALLFFGIYHKNNSSQLNKQTKQFFLLSFNFLLTALLFYFFFPNRLKHWYVFGLATPYIFIFASFFSTLLKIKNKLLTFSVLLLFLVNLFLLFQHHQHIIVNPEFINSTNPSNFANRLHNIDLIYQDANNQGFQVYSYLPSIYDLPQQYTFYWYGTKKYHYQPEKISYLPNQPEYIKNNDLFWTKSKKSKDSLTYLIIEHDLERPDREKDWLTHFSQLKNVQTFSLPYNISIQKRELPIN